LSKRLFFDRSSVDLDADCGAASPSGHKVSIP